MPKSPNVIEGRLLLVSTSEGGRRTALASGYRGALYLGERTDEGLELQHDAVMQLEGREWLAPGEFCDVRIYLVTPELFPQDRLRPGQIFEVKEGHRVVGRVEVAAIERDDRRFPFNDIAG